ncbi:MAG: UDP-galactopyranose mutase [Arcobacteraceae bacterium]|nr:UDP-galactopyranose mutase [Arcobacteraceae bacterium]
MYDCIICGSGFAGSVSANILASKYDKKVLLIEKKEHIGGNCFDCIDDNGILIHKYGPHLFHTSNKQVWEYLSQFTLWDKYEHKVLCSIDGENVPIPFNFNTIEKLFEPEKAKKLQEKLLNSYELNSKVPILELKKSDDVDLQFLADFIYEKVFVNYTAKQWGMKPSELDSAVTARVPVFVGRDDRYFNDEYQAVPKDGYTKLFENLLNHPNIKVVLNTDFRDMVTIENNKFYLNGEEFGGKVIYTGMIDELFDYRFGELPYRSVDMRFQSIDKEYFQEATTINYPNEHNFTRITEFKHIHPIESQKTTILKEYPQNYVRDENTAYYPIFTEDNQDKYNQYMEYSRKFDNLVLIGRLAEYKYYDMDDVVERVLDTMMRGKI